MSQYPRGVETYNNILQHAMELFSEKGYDETSVADICQSAQVSKGAFYHHFPSKQDLFLALMSAWLEKLDELFMSAGYAADDVPAALEEMAHYTGSLFAELKRGFPIILEFWRQASRDPEIWERAIAPYRRFFKFFSKLFQSGIDDGVFSEDLNPELAAHNLMAVVMGLLLQASFDPDGANWQDTTIFGIKQFIKSIRR